MGVPGSRRRDPRGRQDHGQVPVVGEVRHHHAPGAAVTINYASAVRDIVRDDIFAVSLGVPFAMVEGTTRRERINASLSERNWT